MASQYSAIFSEVDKIEPKQAVQTVTTRLKRLRALESEVHDYFKERSMMENAYAGAMTSLSKKTSSFTAAAEFNETSSDVLGEIGKAWTMVAGSAHETSKCHLLLSDRLKMDVCHSIGEHLASGDKDDNKWSKFKQNSTTLLRLSKDWHDKQQRLIKLRKQFEGNKKADDKSEQKIQELETQLGACTAQWMSESAEIFERFREMDKLQIEFIKDTLKRTIEFQINNLKLQVMNLEQSLEQVAKIDPDAEVEKFVQSSNVKSEYISTSIFSSSHPSQKAAASSTKDINENGADQSKDDEQFKVDAEGYRIPQMDREQWKNGPMNASSILSGSDKKKSDKNAGGGEDDSSDDEDGGSMALSNNFQKFKIDIKTNSDAASVKQDKEGGEKASAEDLASAAAFMKNSLNFASGPVKAVQDQSQPKRGRRQTSMMSPSPLTQPSSQEVTPASEVSAMSMSSQMTGNRRARLPSNNSAQSNQTFDPFGSMNGLDTGFSKPAVMTNAQMDLLSFDSFQDIPASSQQGQTNGDQDLVSFCRSNGVQFKFLEVMTTQVSKDGKIKGMKVMGSLQLNSQKLDASFGQFVVKIQCLQDLQVTDLPQYVTFEQSQLKVDISKVVSNFESGKDILLCKYTVEIVEQTSLRMPLIVSGKMNVQPNQTQMVISCEPNYDSLYGKQQQIAQLSDVSVLMTVDEGTSAVITKPVAAYSQEKKKILWRLGNISMRDSEQKLSPKIKLLAQWSLPAGAAERSSTSTPLAVRFVANNVNISSLNLHSPQSSTSNLQEFVSYALGGSIQVDLTVIQQ
ncbi:hypothetical protein MIR68_012341 [Amoeboaphelidium protococcarum]|nr:hypothetical protein MIR68_012341 [Amoeboaphelidium protococcarum]